MTHTCRQNGLSKVFTELFNYEDHEFYIARRNKNKNLYMEMTLFVKVVVSKTVIDYLGGRVLC